MFSQKHHPALPKMDHQTRYDLGLTDIKDGSVLYAMAAQTPRAVLSGLSLRQR